MMDSGRLFLLIMSKAQMGLMMCKLSGARRRYERTMDESNQTSGTVQIQKQQVSAARSELAG
jgi:hypothetical protein